MSPLLVPSLLTSPGSAARPWPGGHRSPPGAASRHLAPVERAENETDGHSGHREQRRGPDPAPGAPVWGGRHKSDRAPAARTRPFIYPHLYREYILYILYIEYINYIEYILYREYGEHREFREYMEYTEYPRWKTRQRPRKCQPASTGGTPSAARLPAPHRAPPGMGSPWSEPPKMPAAAAAWRGASAASSRRHRAPGTGHRPRRSPWC